MNKPSSSDFGENEKKMQLRYFSGHILCCSIAAIRFVYICTAIPFFMVHVSLFDVFSNDNGTYSQTTAVVHGFWIDISMKSIVFTSIIIVLIIPIIKTFRSSPSGRRRRSSGLAGGMILGDFGMPNITTKTTPTEIDITTNVNTLSKIKSAK